MAIVLLMAGLGAAKTCAKAIKEHDVMSMGRRNSSLIRKENDPRLFWITVSFNGLVAAGLFVGSTALVTSAIRGGKNSRSNRPS